MVTIWIEKPLGSDNLALFDYDNLSSTTSSDYRFKYITLENINYGKVNELIECVYRSAPSRARRVVHKDDVLIATVRPLLHSHYLVDEEVRDIICSTGFCVVKTDEEQLHNKYLYQLLFSPLIDSQIEAITAGSNYPAINSNDVKKLIVSLPPLPEQRAIAAALSDADSYIAALEKLIAKKRAIKQGAMQELLTSKRRLPGFKDEWISAPYKSFCEFINGRAYSQEELLSEGKYRVLRLGNFFTSDRWYFSNLELPEKQYCDKGDLLYAWSASFGPVIWHGEKVIYHYHIWKTVVSPSVNKDFFYHYMVFDTQNIMGELQGGTMSHLTKETMESRECTFPKSIDEQAEIASILSDMDAEIDALKAKLKKLKYIKQGMMSELLTGRIRLVEQEAPAKAVAAPKIMMLPKSEAKGHNQKFDDAVMIAGIVNALYSNKYPLGRKKVQKCLYLLRRHQDESTAAFKKKAAGPYADEVRYKGGEPIAKSAHYIATTTVKDKGTTFARGKNISQALGYIESWGKQGDIKWVGCA